MSAVAVEGGYLVNGSKKPCSLARSMDLLTAAVNAPDRDDKPHLAFILVPATQEGVSTHPFWSSNVLAGAESDEVRLTDVKVEEQLIMRVESTDNGELDRLQTVGLLWFELLISASYLGVASALVERALEKRRAPVSDRAAMGARLESAALLLELVARRIIEGDASTTALADTLIARYAVQDALVAACAKAVETLGGMAFIGGDDIAYLAAAHQCLAFHPPSRSSIEASLLDHIDGSGPLLVP
jgi:alkylation response protein AidB-like acyl-CoA dehydrogenase